MGGSGVNRKVHLLTLPFDGVLQSPRHSRAYLWKHFHRYTDPYMSLSPKYFCFVVYYLALETIPSHMQISVRCSTAMQKLLHATENMLQLQMHTDMLLFLLRSWKSELRSLYPLKHLLSSYSKMSLELFFQNNLLQAQYWL